MTETMEQETVKKLSVRIQRSAAEVYAFLSVPLNFAKWASGMGASLRREGGEWRVDTPEGPAVVRFSEPNTHGVLDHQVRLPKGTVYVPLRVVADGNDCELVLTLFRRPGMSDAQLAADAEWVMRDLQAAKRLLEDEAH